MNSARIAIGPLLIAVGVLIVHLATSHQYGFHRDELGFLEDSRFLDWGYVSYPPVTPLLARVASELFGASPAGMRMLPAIAQSVAVLLSGLIARELGGDRWAQTVAAAAVAIAPFAVLTGGLFLYVSFEYVSWVGIGYCVVRLLKSSDPRWWVPIGALVGLGLMTKYTVAVCAIGLGVGLLLTPARGIIRSPWLIAGILIAVVTITPNLIWQVQHTFVSLEFLQNIRERDVRIGRTQGFLPEQLYVGASVVTLPLWLGGLWFYLRSASGAPFRTLGWMYLVSFTVFLVSQGRSYYLAPAYPTLLAAGAVALEGLIAHRSRQFRRITTTGSVSPW
jgi:4-amino-4-deoxy-L-arabinose transferase-like glycosyltransferase